MKNLLLFCVIILSQCAWDWPSGWDLGTIKPAGIIYPVTKSTTNQTLVAGQSGGTVIFTGSNAHTQYTLPVGVPGMEFSFIDDTTNYISVIPQSTDTIEIASTSQGVGVHNTSASIGNSISLICREANIWSLEGQSGTWVTGS